MASQRGTPSRKHSTPLRPGEYLSCWCRECKLSRQLALALRQVDICRTAGCMLNSAANYFNSRADRLFMAVRVSNVLGENVRCGVSYAQSSDHRRGRRGVCCRKKMRDEPLCIWRHSSGVANYREVSKGAS